MLSAKPLIPLCMRWLLLVVTDFVVGGGLHIVYTRSTRFSVPMRILSFCWALLP